MAVGRLWLVSSPQMVTGWSISISPTADLRKKYKNWPIWIIILEWYWLIDFSTKIYPIHPAAICDHVAKASTFSDPNHVKNSGITHPWRSNVHPWKLTWHWKIHMFNRKYIGSFIVDFPAIVMSSLRGWYHLCECLTKLLSLIIWRKATVQYLYARFASTKDMEKQKAMGNSAVQQYPKTADFFKEPSPPPQKKKNGIPVSTSEMKKNTTLLSVSHYLFCSPSWT